jgi:hypothetical protein
VGNVSHNTSLCRELRDRRTLPGTISKKSYGTQHPQSGSVAHGSYSDETRLGEAVGERSVATKTVSMGDDVGGLNRVEFQCVAITTPMGTASVASFLSS